MKDLIHIDAILSPAQDVEGIPVHNYLKMPAADVMTRGAHVDINIPQLAVTSYHNPLLRHEKLPKVPPFQPCVWISLHLQTPCRVTDWTAKAGSVLFTNKTEHMVSRVISWRYEYH